MVSTSTYLDTVSQELASLKDAERLIERELDSLIRPQLRRATSASIHHASQSMSEPIQSLKQLEIDWPSLLRDADQLLSMTSSAMTIADYVSGKVRILDAEHARVTAVLQFVRELEKAECVIEELRRITDLSKSPEKLGQPCSLVHELLKMEPMVMITLDKLSAARGPSPVQFVEAIKKRLENQLDDIVSAIGAHDVVNDIVGHYAMLGLGRKASRALVNHLVMTKISNFTSLNENKDTGSLHGIVRHFSDHSALLLRNDYVPIAKEKLAHDDYLLGLFDLLEQIDSKYVTLWHDFFRDRQLERISRAASLSVSTRTLDETTKVGLGTQPNSVREIDSLIVDTLVITKTSQMFLQLVRSLVLEGLLAQNSVHGSNVICGAIMKKYRSSLDCYIHLELFYCMLSFQKALEMDSTESGSLISSCVDDCFFVMSKSCKRALNVDQVQISSKVLPQIARLFKSFVIDSVIQRCVFRGTESDSNFIIGLNNLESMNRYLRRLVDELSVGIDHLSTFPILDDTIWRQLLSECPNLSTVSATLVEKTAERRTIVRQILSAFEPISSIIERALNSNIKELFQRIVKPRLLTSLQQHCIPSRYASFEPDDLSIVSVMGPTLDSLLGLCKNFTEFNRSNMIILIIDFVAREWESLLYNCTFTLSGAMMFERDLRSLNSYFIDHSQIMAREKFTRLHALALVLNVEDKNEVDDLMNGPLSKDEISRILMLRSDL